MTAHLYIPVGIPGSGKSTLGREWFEPDEIVCPDHYRRIMTGDHTRQDVNNEVFVIVNTITDYRLRNGLSVYLDATNLREKFWPKVSCPVTVIAFYTNHWESIERNEARGNYAVPQHAMDRMVGLFNSFNFHKIGGDNVTLVRASEFRR